MQSLNELYLSAAIVLTHMHITVLPADACLPLAAVEQWVAFMKSQGIAKVSHATPQPLATA
jgi:hypothetical protein